MMPLKPLKPLLLALSLALLIILSQGRSFLGLGWNPPRAKAVDTAALEQAQRWNAEGQRWLDRGQTVEALQAWQQAENFYRQSHDSLGITGSQINQGLALQQLGQYRNACKLLLLLLSLDYRNGQLCQYPNEIEDSFEQQQQALRDALARLTEAGPEAKVRTIGLRVLGDTLRVLGKLDQSEQVLLSSQVLAKSLNMGAEAAATQLSLGNTYWGQYDRDRELVGRNSLRNDEVTKQAVSKAKAALKLYQDLEAAPEFEALYIPAKLNGLNLLAHLYGWLAMDNQKVNDELRQWHTEVTSQLAQLVGELVEPAHPAWSKLSSLPPSLAIHSRLRLANSLIQFPEDLLSKSQHAALLAIAFQQVHRALAEAKALPTQTLMLAHVQNTLGFLHEKTKDWRSAQTFTQQALNSVRQSVLQQRYEQTQGLIAQWEFQLARIYQAQGDIDSALEAFARSAKALDTLQDNVLTVDPTAQVHFQDQVKPIYEQYLQLLLSDPQPKNLQIAIQVSNQRQLTELQNQLQCSELKQVSLQEIAPKPDAVIYTITLPDRIGLIVEIFDTSNSTAKLRPEKTSLHYYPAALDRIQDNLIHPQDMDSGNKPDVDDWIKPQAKILYEELLQPAKAQGFLPSAGTLVFALDGDLVNLPIALLYDGQDYLIQHYRLAILPAAKLPVSQPLTPSQLRLLTAGLSVESESFKKAEQLSNTSFGALTEVKKEVEGLRDLAVQELLNETFKREAFQTAFQTGDFPVVHISTHGMFSSNPEQTFLLAFDDLITLRQLDRVIRGRTRDSLNPISLLVLSACQTAQGDRQAALGIAGVALQAGVSSTIASLWNIDAKSTALFMKQFYTALRNKASKAEALRQAQLFLFQHPDYQHPYYWAAFVLVGNWL